VSLSLQPGEPFNPFRMFTGVFIPEGLVRCNRISAGAKLAWGRLARYAGENGRCYPTVKSLAAEIGLGERQGQKYLTELERARLIRRVCRFNHRGQTSNEFEFLWHEMFTQGVNDRSGEGVNDPSLRGVNDRSPKESQIEESHDEENKHDLDSLPRNRKNRDSPPVIGSQSVCKQYPLVRERLAQYMQLPGEKKKYPSERTVVDIMDAAGTHDERELIEALNYLHDGRGLKPFTEHGPRSFAWFKTVLQDHFTKKRDRESAANPCGYAEWEGRNETRLSKAQFETMTDAIEVCG
jgi:Helix-turn-helix domain